VLLSLPSFIFLHSECTKYNHGTSTRVVEVSKKVDTHREREELSLEPIRRERITWIAKPPTLSYIHLSYFHHQRKKLNKKIIKITMVCQGSFMSNEPLSPFRSLWLFLLQDTLTFGVHSRRVVSEIPKCLSKWASREEMERKLLATFDVCHQHPHHTYAKFLMVKYINLEDSLDKHASIILLSRCLLVNNNNGKIHWAVNLSLIIAPCGD